jgi:thiol-disulfide isomerase/thioredoxin
MKKKFLFIIVCLVCLESFAYEITVFRRNTIIRDQDIFLKECYGREFRTIDTAYYDKVLHGHRFSKDIFLKPGTYELENILGEHFEFFINDSSQTFTITTDFDPFGENLVFKGSNINQDFVELNNETKHLYAVYLSADSALVKDSTLSVLQKEKLKHDIAVYSDSIQMAKKKFADKYPNSYIALVFKMAESYPVIYPDSLMYDSTSNVDKNDLAWKRFCYHKNHFFDSIDLKDARYLRVPTFHFKIMDYLKDAPQNMITLTYMFDVILEKSKPVDSGGNNEVFRYYFDFFSGVAERGRSGNLDSVYIYLTQKYLLDDDAPWLSEANKRVLKRKIDKKSKFLQGKIPPKMSYRNVLDEKNQDSLYSILGSDDVDFTIVVFFEPDCPHCQQELGKLRMFADKKDKYNFEIIAIANEIDVDKVKKYVYVHGFPFKILLGRNAVVDNRVDIWDIDAVPTIFLLDKQKRIIAKHITTEDIEKIIPIYKQ